MKRKRKTYYAPGFRDNGRTDGQVAVVVLLLMSSVVRVKGCHWQLAGGSGGLLLAAWWGDNIPEPA